jgi:DNA-binding transcriptional LysR family regulator
MDRLRAMEYFVRAVEAGSFAKAARELSVSPPAITKLIAAFERHLGTTLLRRGSRHLSLTPDGERLYPICARALSDLSLAEAHFSASRQRVAGKLTVGMSRIIGEHCVAPFLGDFLARHPDLELDLRIVHLTTEPAAALVDVMVLIGWLDETDFIAKQIGQTRFVTCAAPAYWQARGIPRNPDELKHHDCLAYRTPRGAVLDLWRYRRGNEMRAVPTTPRVISEDRDWNTEAAARGLGVVLVGDLTARPYFESGLLQPVLQDWEGLEAPPVYVLYRRGARASARVRAFIDFVTELFARFEASREADRKISTIPRPAWHRSKWVGPLTRRARLAGEAAPR